MSASLPSAWSAGHTLMYSGHSIFIEYRDEKESKAGTEGEDMAGCSQEGGGDQMRICNRVQNSGCPGNI